VHPIKDDKLSLEENIQDINDLNLSFIKKYAPNLYNTFEFTFDEDDENYNDSDNKKIFYITLRMCGCILEPKFRYHFKEKLQKEKMQNYQMLILI
jgi:hypothetical protein